MNYRENVDNYCLIDIMRIVFMLSGVIIINTLTKRFQGQYLVETIF